MNVEILRALVQSRREVIKETEELKQFDEALKNEEFPPTNRYILSVLQNAFTDLISRKISQTVYQRFCIKLQVIDVLRDWTHPYKNLDCSRSFYQGEEVLELAAKVLRIYLTDELLNRDDDNINLLTNLAKALLGLVPKKQNLTQDLERVIRRISELKQTEESTVLLCNVIKKKDSLNLSPETVERIYIAQRIKLIEEPIAENLILYLKGSSKEFTDSESTNKLLAVSVNFPTIFQISCSVLKEIFESTNFPPKVLEYIKCYLESLDKMCREKQKKILDLYPLRLQALVILLRIKPEFHTKQSREHAIVSLMTINEINPEDALILMTHYPSWMKLLTARLSEVMNFELIEGKTNDDKFLTSMIIDDK